MKNLDNTNTIVQDPLLEPVLIACGTTSNGHADNSTVTPEGIGFKAYNLVRMADLNLPVPQAFVLGTAWCNQAQGLKPDVWQEALRSLEKASGTRFGDTRHPLLLSVRSGAAISMPGMMETLLNIGLCDTTLSGFLRLTGNPKLVWDAYRRLVSGFGEVVMGVDVSVFESDLLTIAGNRDERELDFSELRALTEAHLTSIERVTGKAFPQDPHEQLEQAIAAVFASWSADKARDYRRLNQLDDSMGTAVTVQRMVFGNAGGLSGAGVGFTRHPSTGADEPWVDFLFNAQGEDVVSGRRSVRSPDALATAAPQIWDELISSVKQLEQAFGDMQDFEFTVENGHLWLLQTRNGKRTTQAQARITLDLLHEGVITADEARQRTSTLNADNLAVEHIVAEGDNAAAVPISHAISAAHGIAIGEIALDEQRAHSRHAQGVPIILVRHDAETSDIVALEIAEGLLTARGARTSHAAVVARQLSKVCLVACDTLQIDLARRSVKFDDLELAEGDVISLDGHNGAIYQGSVTTKREVPAELMSELEKLRSV